MQRPSVAYAADVVSTRVVGDEPGAEKSHRHHAHVVHAGATKLTFYPAYTFRASPTWFKWVKLTCSDIHATLQPHQKYSSVTTGAVRDARFNAHGRNNPPLLLFYLNHPIQFVQVIGVVVAVEEYFDKFWLFTVDDSSGATIDVTCPRPEKKHEGHGSSRPALNTTGDVQKQKDDGAEHDPHPDSDPDHELLLLQSTISRLDIGTAVQAKGTLTTFRGTRQLSLLRLSIIPSTSQEMRLISSRSQFYSSVLSDPWSLTREDQRKLQAEAQGERDEEIERAKKRRNRDRMKREREERHSRAIQREYEREEETRKREAEQARSWGEELKQKQAAAKKPDEPKPEEVWVSVG